MDIDKLKEDIESVESDLEYGEYQDQGKVAVNVECLRSVIDFANEAIAHQSVKSEEVQRAIEQVEGTRRKAQKELDSLIETKSRYDHQIEIGDPWNWKWEESWHPLAVEGCKQTIKNANLAITALQAVQNAKTTVEKKYDDFRSYNIQGDCYKYVCSCGHCKQSLWEIPDYQYFKNERGHTPNYCPNCGSKLN